MGATTVEGLTPMQVFAAGKRKWPKAGETWYLTDVTEQQDIWKDKECTIWGNRMKSKRRDDSGDLRNQAILIVSSEAGAASIEIRGTDKMKFVKGWLSMIDKEGNWAVQEKPS